MSNITKIAKEIIDLHSQHFMPLQYSKGQLKCDEYHGPDIIPTIRITQDFGSKTITADVIVWNGRKSIHEFMDGSWYDNDDGIGNGTSLEGALKDLLRKTKLSIKEGK